MISNKLTRHRFILSPLLGALLSLASSQAMSMAAAPEPAPSPGAGNSVTSDEVGAIGGSFAVSPTGDATYTIPFVVPPGTAGVAPQIGLRYSSNAGNGIAGKGMSLTGLSSISRCRQTLQQDGNAEPIRFGPTDRFCLDGQRLILVDGTYGAPDSEYRTEIDSYRRIYARGGTTGSPDTFEVHAKDGSTSYYGLDQTDARMHVYTAGGTPGPVMKWNISRFHDSVGNRILYNYNDIAHRITLIRYAFGTDPAGGVRIEFDYESRADKIINYIGGYVWEEPHRLSSVTMRNDGKVFRHYILHYLGYTSGGYNRLGSIRECADTAEQICLEPTTFAWTAQAVANAGFEPTTSSIGAVSVNYVDSQPADLNGDGYRDFLWIGTRSSGEIELNAALYDPGTNLFVKPNCVDPFTCGANERIELNKAARKAWRVVDFNGDGSQDLSFIDKGGDLKVLLTLPGGPAFDFRWQHLFTPGKEYSTEDQIDIGTGDAVSIAWGDLNSDGLPDLIYRNASGGVRVRLMERNPEPQICPSGWPTQLSCAYRLGPDDYFFKFETDYGFYMAELVMGDQFNVTDFDGDGRVDVLAYQSIYCGDMDNPEFYFPNIYRACSGPYQHSLVAFRTAEIDEPSKRIVVKPFSVTEVSGSATTDIIPGDFNGDGRGEILFHNGSTPIEWHYQLSSGSSLERSQVLGVLSDSEKASLELADVNRDGYPDIVFTHGAGGEAGSASLRAFLWDQEGNSFLTPQMIETGLTAGETRHHRLFDVNGDGASDWLNIDWGSSNGTVRTSLAKSPHVAMDKIKSINNGLGLDIKVDYTNLTDPARPEFYVRDTDAHETSWNLSWLEADVPSQNPRPPTFDIAPAMYAVESVCTTSPADGNTGNCAHGEGGVSRQFYSYKGAKIQGEGRGFLGFREVRVDDHQSNTHTVTEYRQDFPHTGKPRLVYRYHDNGRLLSKLFNSYSVAPNNVDLGHINKGKVFNAYTWIVSEETFDPDTGLHVGQTVTVNAEDVVAGGVDPWGNLKYSKVEHKSGTNLDVVATITTVNDFGTGYSREKGRLKSSEVFHERDGVVQSRRATFSYYANGIHLGLLKTENVTGGDGADEVALATTTYFYDIYGNKTRVMQVGSSQTRAHYWDYDEGRYVKREKARMKGIDVTTREVLARDPVLGLPTRQRDVNGVETTSVYGKFGRLFFQYQNTGSWSRSRFSTYNGNCPAGTAYVNTTEASGGGSGITCYDALGREIMVGTIGFNGGYDRVDTVYNEQGQVVSQSNPYNDSSNGTVSNTYDDYGRLIKVTHPDNNFTEYAYSGLTTTVTNAKGQVRTETRNAKGELVQATDNGGTITYVYDSAGNLTQTTVAANDTVTTTVIYDSLGRKIEIRDPDKGAWRYEYNQFGELIKQTNAKEEYTEISYDDLGRRKERKDYTSGHVHKSSTKWTWDTNGDRSLPGSLIQVEHSDNYSLNDTYTEDLAYDDFGRLSWREVVISGLSPVRQSYTYDEYGRPFQVYGTADAFTGEHYFYNTNGYLSEVKDSAIVDGVQKTWYTVNSLDPRGNQTEITLHTTPSPVTVTRNYDELTGRLERIHATDSVNVLQDWNLTGYDNVGNLTGMSDDVRGDAYGYTYDSLNRLKKEFLNGPEIGLTTYTANGNIKTKNGTTYSYGSRPHAVTSAGGTSYGYDANGNMISGGGRSITYTAFDKPHTITKSGNTAKFAYGPERSRFKQVSTVGGTTVTKYYVLGLEILNKNGGWEYRRDIGGVAQETTTRDSGNNIVDTKRYFYLRDHLGSVDMILNEAGFEATDMRFGAWGERRSADIASQVIEYPDPGGQLDYLTQVTDRGFTGHEMLDAFGLIHMNGRVYDPKLGRFLSADPFVQAPANTQSYNRYTYVINNPLGYIDPSGYRFSGTRKILIEGNSVGPASFEFDDGMTILSGFGGISLGDVVDIQPVTVREGLVERYTYPVASAGQGLDVSGDSSQFGSGVVFAAFGSGVMGSEIGSPMFVLANANFGRSNVSLWERKFANGGETFSMKLALGISPDQSSRGCSGQMCRNSRPVADLEERRAELIVSAKAEVRRRWRWWRQGDWRSDVGAGHGLTIYIYKDYSGRNLVLGGVIEHLERRDFRFPTERGSYYTGDSFSDSPPRRRSIFRYPQDMQPVGMVRGVYDWSRGPDPYEAQTQADLLKGPVHIIYYNPRYKEEVYLPRE